MKEMIRLMGITKEFEDELIIPTLNLTIYDGEFVTLLGPSGCGKTTMLRMIAGLETPTQGHIFLDNEDVTHLAPYKRNVNMVGLSYQQYILFVVVDAGFALKNHRLDRILLREGCVIPKKEAICPCSVDSTTN